MVTARRSREAREGTIGSPAIMAAAALAFIAVAAPARLVPDLGTLADVFSLIALPATLAVFYIARRLYYRARRAREISLRARDARDREHVESAIDLCRTLVAAAMRAKRLGRTTYDMAMLHHVATDVGMARTRHGHMFDEGGLVLAERIRESTLIAILEGTTCTQAALSYMDRDLVGLRGHLLDIDDPRLAELRRQEAWVEDPGH